jgi:hypothetical protein
MEAEREMHENAEPWNDDAAERYISDEIASKNLDRVIETEIEKVDEIQKMVFGQNLGEMLKELNEGQ